MMQRRRLIAISATGDHPGSIGLRIRPDIHNHIPKGKTTL